MSEEAAPSIRRTQGSSSRGGSRFVPPSVAELQPEFEGQYEILSMLGAGGMGAVYKARQTRLDRLVALKVLPRALGEGAGFAARFEREAQAMAKLKHPRIVSLYDFGETPGGLLYIAMEFVQGRTLQDWIEARGLKHEQILAIIAQICEALNYAHSLGIVHRDIKPQNIMIDVDRMVKIMDFGLAKSLHDGASLLTLAGEGFGTPDYVAPEQMAGDNVVDHRADIYALGVLFYQMLTGSVPRGNFLAPSQKDGTLDPRLDDLVLRAMQPEPDTRFQEVSELWTELEHIRTTTFSHVPASPPRRVTAAPVAQPRSSSRGVLFATVASLGVVGIGAWWMSQRSQPAPVTLSQVSVAAPAVAVVAAPTLPPVPPKPEPVIGTAPAPMQTPAPAITAPAVAPQPTVPAPVVPPPAKANEVDARLADIDARFQEAMNREVSRPHDEAVAKLNAQYAAALERTAGGGLPPADVAAFRAEIERVRAQQPPAEDAPAVPALAPMRATYRDSLAKLIRARDVKAQPVWAGYDKLLNDYQTELTRQDRIDDALKVKAKRAVALAARPPEPAQATVAATPAPKPGVTTVPVPSTRPPSGSPRELNPVEWALSVAATLTLEKDGQPVTAGSAEQILKDRLDVVGITFPPTVELTDADMERLARWKKLRKVEATGAHRITDEGMRVFRNMEQLSEFKLQGPGNGITDAGLACLGNSKGLAWIILNTTGITGSGFAKLRDCTNLQVINLTNAPVTGEGLEHIEELPALINLMLVNDTALRDEALAKFRAPAPLLLFDLTGCTGITRKGVAALKGIQTVIAPKN